MSKKMEYLVMAQHVYQVEEKKWTNVGAWYSVKNRYYSTEAEARKALASYVAKWNKDFQYDKDGKRIETQVCGMIGIDVVSRKQDDDRLRVVAWKIKRREVTDWEEVDAG
jgi:hypothetical protein